MSRCLILFTAIALIFSGCGSEPTETAETAAVQPEPEAVVETPALCVDAGPQTPRDISNPHGLNTTPIDRAPAPSEMNLCNLHTHTNAEHKGPGFSVFVDDSDYGGYACNETADLTEAELEPLEGAYGKVKPGDTIEVHWVHTSCPIETPGPTLNACVTDTCGEPLLRVEAQTFLVVNDSNALDFAEFAYNGTVRNDFHQAASLPSGTGDPVEFFGSSTGPDFTQSECSPFKVTWSVRPTCAKLDIASLHRWAESDNIFGETESHGVRQLVTAPELLAPIQ